MVYIDKIIVDVFILNKKEKLKNNFFFYYVKYVIIRMVIE